MADSAERIRQRLPAAWRPDRGADDLASEIIRRAGGLLDGVALEADEVMRAHWFPFADRAELSRWFALSRAARGLGAATPAERDDHDVLDDLARLARLVADPPRRSARGSVETVEEYRRRVRELVAVYREGLGTVGALERMTAAMLPADGPTGMRPFTVEEGAALLLTEAAATTAGAPDGVVGPLMRWRLRNDGLGEAIPTIWIEGIEATADHEETAEPMVELLSGGGRTRRLAVGWSGTLAPGQVLRLRAGHRSLLATAAGLVAADSSPGDSTAADPTAPGPWGDPQSLGGNPVQALLRASNGTVWAATRTAAGSQIYRRTSRRWHRAVSRVTEVLCLGEDGAGLILGTRTGLRRVQRHPSTGRYRVRRVSSTNAREIRCIERFADGSLWLGTDRGAGPLRADGTWSVTVLGDFDVRAMHEDAMGERLFGGDDGLVLHQPGLERWQAFVGGGHTEQEADWVSIEDDTGAAALDSVALPGVRSLHSSGGAVWIGTTHGLARYRARPVRGLAYTTDLEAFPSLGEAAVHAIERDDRGRLWFATERGLFVFDGRAWLRAAGGSLQRIDPPPDLDVPWRFDRGGDRWQRYDRQAQAWTTPGGDPLAAEPAVRAVAWRDTLIGELGSGQGASFVAQATVPRRQLFVHHKPVPTRIDDDLPLSLPRLPVGGSVWRYLSREPDPLPVSEPDIRPAWTTEGRLLPEPQDVDAPRPGRYSEDAPAAGVLRGSWDRSVWAYPPSARVRMAWRASKAATVVVRLGLRGPDDVVDPEVIDRVWWGIKVARPAGVHVALAVGEEIVKGATYGAGD